MFDLTLARCDRVVFYTDSLIEAADETGKLLGETGLLDAASRLDAAVSTPGEIGSGLLREIGRHRGRPDAGDDLTLIVLHHSASGPRRLSVRQKVDVYAKIFGLKHV
jgi:serine phosphatase RsbU (regulator of sigma subunit)